ncbi:S9 family peptidase [Peristeroidobacter soli]|uniref:S9 family peptidase n=1 Tax=Peristeroidobacter soli TaxID=2497877 RepID=UPI00101BC7F4|nr:prolyl oligopeptidase family serine peptidase [Peristeroidobacter soli]
MEDDPSYEALYREAERMHTEIWRPGSGEICDVREVQVVPGGQSAVFAGAVMGTLEGLPRTGIFQIDLGSAETQLLSLGPHTDRLPKCSPDGQVIAFLSDRNGIGNFQLHFIRLASRTVLSAPSVDGWVEYFHWSPDGRQILLGVAGHGADVSGVNGAVTSKRDAESCLSWMPTVDDGVGDNRWRSTWVYDLDNDRVRRVSPVGCNTWEAVWCGNRTLTAVTSYGPSEGLWYSARLSLIDVQSGEVKTLYVPKEQLGCPACSPSGRSVAVVEAICSDRGLVAGVLLLIDSETGECRYVPTGDVDVAYLEWCSETRLLLAGHRGLETVVGHFDPRIGAYRDVWRSCEISTGGVYVTVASTNPNGDCVLVGEGFARAPEIALICNGTYRRVKSFDNGYTKEVSTIGSIETVSWQSTEGLQIQGWLLTPQGKGPFPMVMNIHGGPVWHWRQAWLGRRLCWILMLINRGFAVFLPNPRGSSGRGHRFARYVVGDMGGADTCDYMSGLDHLCAAGVADPTRLGVTGISYGGFMTAWLITQRQCFAAAVAVAPTTNHVTQRLLSNIPEFVDLFLADSYNNPGGKYFRRSPIIYANRVKTPTLNVCGLLDRCTPPEEAAQFHRALLENRVRSVLVTYPEEGHGVRKFPALLDYSARVVAWFLEHMPALNPI